MTKKLYYIDAYIKEFDAKVLSAEPCDGGYDVILDATAFFPEEGGQSSDDGYIADAEVTYVYEKDGLVHHRTSTMPNLGDVHCKINFAGRFEKMQCHTAEHMLCGIIHRLYGFENVGFHLGADEVTFDVSGVLDRGQLEEVEMLANRAVFANQKVETIFPTAEELTSIEYRAKLDITDGVRLVKIGDVDTCACCAPHVGYTGEIGIIKILDFMKHRGGTRIWMVAGERALADYRTRYENIKRISAMLSTPQIEVANTLEGYIADSEKNKAALKNARLKIAELYASSIEEQEGSSVFLLEDFTIPELIAFSNIASRKIKDITVALSGVDGDYKYVISSASRDLRAMAKDINSALNGRGGGRAEMIQGSFSSTLKEIKEYFK